jgi:hypothetical protein
VIDGTTKTFIRTTDGAIFVAEFGRPWVPPLPVDPDDPEAMRAARDEWRVKQGRAGDIAPRGSDSTSLGREAAAKRAADREAAEALAQASVSAEGELNTDALRDADKDVRKRAKEVAEAKQRSWTATFVDSRENDRMYSRSIVERAKLLERARENIEKSKAAASDGKDGAKTMAKILKSEKELRDKLPTWVENMESLDLYPYVNMNLTRYGPTNVAAARFSVDRHRGVTTLAVVRDTPERELFVYSGDTFPPAMIETPLARGVVDVQSNAIGVYWLTEDGNIEMRGDFKDEDTRYLFDAAAPRRIDFPVGSRGVVQMSVGPREAIALTADGVVYEWRMVPHEEPSRPQAVQGSQPIGIVSRGTHYRYMIARDGTVYVSRTEPFAPWLREGGIRATEASGDMVIGFPTYVPLEETEQEVVPE